MSHWIIDEFAYQLYFSVRIKLPPAFVIKIDTMIIINEHIYPFVWTFMLQTIDINS